MAESLWLGWDGLPCFEKCSLTLEPSVRHAGKTVRVGRSMCCHNTMACTLQLPTLQS